MATLRFWIPFSLSLVSTSALAAPPCPGSPHASVQAAIDAAAPGATVTICDGTFTERLVISGKTLTLASQNGALLTTIDAQFAGPALTVTGGADVTVVGLAFVNGLVAGTGGNISCSASTLALSDSRLVAGSAGVGGGLGAVGCDGSVAGTTFEGNAATDGGGAWIDGDTFLVQGNTFDGNHADEEGGGLYVDGSSDVIGNTFVNNDTDLYGGAVYANGSNGEISWNYVGYNTSIDDGAGVYAYEGAGVVQGNTFEGNDSGDDAGGLRTKLSATVVLDNTFIANHADNLGGGAKISHEATTLTGNRFIANTSWVGGGGLLLEESASLVADNRFEANEAPDGAGLYLLDGWDAVVIEDTVFVGNDAAGNGGAVFVDMFGQEATFRRVRFERGEANQGAGIYAFETAIDVENCTFARNTAWTAGAAMYLSGVTGEVENSVAWGNSSAGGALRVSNGQAALDVANSVIAKTQSGPALYVSSGVAPTWRYNDLWSNPGHYFGLPSQTGINGNLEVDPLFRNAKKGNFQLLVGSPLIDAGDPLVSDTDGTRSDIGRYGGPAAW